MSSNKIKFGLKNVHIAIQTYAEATGVYSYATPVKLPGAVNLSLEPQGDASPFYADDIVYYRSLTNAGYNGSLEIALVPDWFRKSILQETEDDNGVFVENSGIVDPVCFALLFEFDGDDKKIRHCMYNCSVTRPSVGSQTKEASITPGTETLNLSCDPRADGLVKVKTSDTTKTAVFNNWYGSVYVPNATMDPVYLTALTIGSLTLTPTFDDETFAYTTSTTNDSDSVAATGVSGASVNVKVNGEAITNGTSPTWETGNNNVEITVSKTGYVTTVYSVTVVKSAS